MTVATILGCGTSTGVPRIGNDWGACDPGEPRNRRGRCSILIRQGGKTLLIDTSPDLRQQMLANGIDRIDAVIFTHDHADQTHGIDDLRAFALLQRRKVDVYGDEPTLESLHTKFRYCFEDVRGYHAILKAHEFGGIEPFEVAGIRVQPIQQEHGTMASLGFRFGDLAYCNDVLDLPEEAFPQLQGVKVWIVDALRYRAHPTHAHLQKTFRWIERVRPDLAVLTNLHIDLDYRTLQDELPPGIVPAYDGMVVEA